MSKSRRCKIAGFFRGRCRISTEVKAAQFFQRNIELATGISSEQFVGKTNAELGMPEDIYSVWYDSLRQVFATGQEQTIEFKFPTLKGSRWYQSRLVPEFASDGSVETVLRIARDVTDYKQVEQAQDLRNCHKQ